MRPKVIDVPLYQDDRGSVYCALDNMHEHEIKRTYVVENHSKGMVRAWHGHLEAHTYMHVISGAVKFAALNMGNMNDVTIVTMTARKPQLFYVPAGFYNGAESLTDGTKIMVYSTLSFDEVKEDDQRLRFDYVDGIWGVKYR